VIYSTPWCGARDSGERRLEPAARSAAAAEGPGCQMQRIIGVKKYGRRDTDDVFT
jgi:hypothetical protein